MVVVIAWGREGYVLWCWIRRGYVIGRGYVLGRWIGRGYVIWCGIGKIALGGEVGVAAVEFGTLGFLAGRGFLFG